MCLVFLGPPGSGKGTIAKLLLEKIGVIHISTGDIFRENIRRKTPLGLQVQSILDDGAYVPDTLTNELLRSRLLEKDVHNGYILDGYPRTVPQAKALEGFARISGVVELVLTEEKLIQRLAGRLICQNCFAIYNRISIVPKQQGICDTCGGDLVARKDDCSDSVKKRLQVYRDHATPLREYYRKCGLLISLNVDCPKEEILEKILNFLKL